MIAVTASVAGRQNALRFQDQSIGRFLKLDLLLEIIHN